MRRQGTVRDSPSIKITSIVTIEIIEYVSQQSVGSMPLNMQVVLSQLLLADVSHRSFMTKQELSYHVMQLPDVKRSFANVDLVSFYHRAYLNMSTTGPRER